MRKYIVEGGLPLSGTVTVSGSKNVVLKALIAACLTDEEITLTNVPLISDAAMMMDIIRELGGTVEASDHTVKVRMQEMNIREIPLEMGAKIRTSSMFLAPLLARLKKASIPNPGGCRIGARPIDRHIKGLEAMGAEIGYAREDGYFHAETDGLQGTDFTFDKNTHTGTETLILAAVLAKGKTTLRNAATEPEVDELIDLLRAMGAKIKRNGRIIEIEGVEKLHGATHEIAPDRNEVVTFAIASALTGGNIVIQNVQEEHLEAFLDVFSKAGGAWEKKEGGIRFYIKDAIQPVDVVTEPHPGFMTDWQAPWAVLMTQAGGESVIHEAVYESRFNYVPELVKMGAKIALFNPSVENAQDFYNFNYEDHKEGQKHAIKITGKTQLHNAVITVSDLRAGATLVLAALIAKGRSVVYGIEHLERGYETFDERLSGLGAQITVKEER